MSTTWPGADPRLERTYRRLMLAYPGRYRRRHGTEIVTTLLELSAPGQRHPGRGDAWHLLASGLRQRFRLPTGRPLTVIAAVLTTLITGAFGAAAGSWAATQTFAPPPAAALSRHITGAEPGTTSVEHLSPWADTGLYTSTQVAGTWPIEHARQRLHADGWHVGPVTPLSGSAVTYDPATGATIDLVTHNSQFRAGKDGVELDVRAFLTDRTGSVKISAWPRATTVFLPSIITGTLAGLLTGWLLAAAGAYRLRHSRRPRTAATTATLAVLTLALPAVALYGNLMRAFRYAGDFGPVFTVHSAFHPGPYYPFGPPWLIPGLTAAGLALAATTALIARPGPAATTEHTPAAG